jgi:hypothetical protein
MGQKTLLMQVFINGLQVFVEIFRMLTAQVFDVFKYMLEVMRIVLQMLFDLPFCFAEMTTVRLFSRRAGMVPVMLTLMRMVLLVVIISHRSRTPSEFLVRVFQKYPRQNMKPNHAGLEMMRFGGSSRT